MKITTKIVVTTILTGTALIGCGSYNDKRGRGDAPVTGRDDTPAEVLNFPDLFANVAHKCDGHGHRVFTSTREAPPVVVDDASCGR